MNKIKEKINLLIKFLLDNEDDYVLIRKDLIKILFDRLDDQSVGLVLEDKKVLNDKKCSSQELAKAELKGMKNLIFWIRQWNWAEKVK